MRDAPNTLDLECAIDGLNQRMAKMNELMEKVCEILLKIEAKLPSSEVVSYFRDQLWK